MNYTTEDDILCGAKELIVKWGWQRQAWPEYGPAPRCIRAALQHSAQMLEAKPSLLTGAVRRVSEAIYGRGTVGGILDYEHRKSTNRDSVIAVLQKAIELGPSVHLWPTGAPT